MTRWRSALALLVSVLFLTAGTLTSPAPLGPSQIDSIGPVAGPTDDRSLLRKAPPGIESEEPEIQVDAIEPSQPAPATSATPSSPWETDRLVVAIEPASAQHYETNRRLLEAALEYWNTAGSEYATYDANFTLKPTATDPDIIVRFNSSIDCTTARWELGCAPVITPDSTIDGPAIVRIDTGYTNETTRRVLKHEFGHILGIRHGEPPTSLMRPHYAATTKRQLPNASERANPWGRTDLTVYVAEDRLPPWNTDLYYDQIRHALTYYQEGAEGTAPESLTFQFVDRRSEANIVISYWSPGACDGVMVGSCSSSAGVDLDNDDSDEYLTQMRIALSGIKPRAVGWHVGYWTGMSLEPAGESALAPPFRSTDPADRTGKWWADEPPTDSEPTADDDSASDTPESRLGQSIAGSHRYNRSGVIEPDDRWPRWLTDDDGTPEGFTDRYRAD